MYKAVIRRALFGRKFQRTQAQLAMGETANDDEDEDDDNDDAVAMWHYFVHFPGWKVSHDRWASAPDVFVMDEATIAYADCLTKEHRELHKRMSLKSKGKKLKRYQKVNAVQFLAEWSKRMNQITAELPEGTLKQALDRWHMSRQGSFKKKQEADKQEEEAEMEKPPSADRSQALPAVASIPPKKRRKMSLLPLPPDVVENEMKLQKDGLSSKQRSTVSITLPLGLKKILVEQWELICQCDMLPVLPSAFTIHQALESYLASKECPTAVANGDLKTTNKESGVTKPTGEPKPSSSDSSPSLNPGEWKIMADGISQLFNESLRVRLLYEKELKQLDLDLAAAEIDYTQAYGCEHLLRLFVKLPDILSDNLTPQQYRPIVAKVNDLIRFLHKNHATFFQQQNKKGPLHISNNGGSSPAKRQKPSADADTSSLNA